MPIFIGKEGYSKTCRVRPSRQHGLQLQGRNGSQISDVDVDNFHPDG